MQFRKDSPEDERHNIFTLPQLPSRGARNKNNSSTVDTLDSRKNTRMLKQTNIKIDGSPMRHSLEASKAKEYEEMKKEMQSLYIKEHQKGDRLNNLQSAKQVQLTNTLSDSKQQQLYMQQARKSQDLQLSNKLRQNINGQSSNEFKKTEEDQIPEIQFLTP